MKNILILILLFVGSYQCFSQTKGISYQAVVLNPNQKELPGANAQSSLLVNNKVAVQFTISDEFGNKEFQEFHKTTTDAYGMISLIIGHGTASINNFENIIWNGFSKKLKVEIDFSGSGTDFKPLSEQELTFMPQPALGQDAQAILDNTAEIIAEEIRATNAELGIQADVDSNETAANTTIANVQTDVDSNEAASISADATLQTNIDTVQADVDANETAANTAIVSVQTDVDSNEAASILADATLQTNIDTLQSDVDANETAANTAIATVQTDVDLNEAASISADATLQTNINAVQADVDSNETAANTAIANVQTDVDANEAASISADATLQTNIDTVQADVDANKTAANTAIVSVQTDVDSNEAASILADATLQTNIDTLQSEVDANETAANTAIVTVQTDVDLNEAASISADATLQTNIDTVQADVDSNETAANTAIANVQTDVDANEAASISADSTLQTNIDTVQADVDANETAANTAIVSVQTDVDSNEAASILADATLQTNIDTVQSDVDANETAANTAIVTVQTDVDLNEAASISADATLQTNIDTVQADVDSNETAANTAIANVQTDVDANEAAGISADTTLQTNINAVQADVDANEAAANTALDLKANIASPTFTGVPLAPTATTGTNTTQIATTAFVQSFGAGYLPLSGGTLTGALSGTTGDFSSNVKVSSLTLRSVTKVWELGLNGSDLVLHQGGCCNRLTIDGDGRFGIGANYTPSYQLDVQGDGRFTSSVTATSFIKSGGTSSQFLKADGTVDATVYAPLASPTFTGTPSLPTGTTAITQTAGNNTIALATTAFVTTATTGKFVDLTTNQTISGVKTFNSNINVKGLIIGLGAAGVGSNTSIGVNALVTNSSGVNNVAIGEQAGFSITGSNNVAIGTATNRNAAEGDSNVAIGNGANYQGTSGSNNISLGSFAYRQGNSGSSNIAMGLGALYQETTGSNNIALGDNSSRNNDGGEGNITLGYHAGNKITTGDYNVVIGYDADVSSGTLTNATAIGNGAVVTASNTIQLGNSSVTAVNTSGAVTASLFIKSGGTSSQFLKADGSVDAAAYAPLASPNFTGTVSGITSTMVGLGNLDNTSDANKPVSTATQTALDLKVDKVTGKGLSTEDYSTTEKTKLAAITGTNTGDQDLSSYATNANLALKANIASPTFTGTVSGITSTMVGLANVNNTSDANKPVSTAGQAALDLKVDKVTGKGLSTEDYSTSEKTKLAAITGSNTGDQDLSSYATNTNLALKADIASPTFTGTVSGITSTMVGLANVDNTSDANKPVSTAGQTALDLKANLDSPTFTGTPLAPTATAGTSTTQLATTAFVSEAFDTVISDGLAAQTLAIGDFVGGGVVFWVDPVDNSKGLVCSIDDQSNGIQWYNGSYLTTGATATAVETGVSNTDAIIAVQGATETNYAAGLARAYNGGGFTDWYLPSKDELNQMSINRGTINGIATTNGGVNFGGGSSSYWSSTETGSSAWALFFGNAHQQSFNKNTIRRVRAVRAVGFPAISSLTTITAEQAAQNTAIDLKVDKVTGKGLSTEDYSTTEKTKLAAITGTNTGDQDLSSFATNANLALKANIASPTFTGIPTFPTGSIATTQTAGNNTTAIATTAFVTTATSGKFVDLTTNQTIAGTKTFSNDVTINGIRVGHGVGDDDANVALGTNLGTGTGTRNTALGSSAMDSYEGTSFDNNTSIGYYNLRGLTTGNANTSVGAEAMLALTTGADNTSIGNQVLINTTGSRNTGVGSQAGNTNTSGNNNTFLGYQSNASNSALTNATAIGSGASVTSDNTVQLGNGSVTLVNTSGSITAGAVTYPNTDGTANQVLKTDGSGLLSWTTPAATITEVAAEVSPTNGQTSFTLTQTPSANSKVKMYVNGIRISNSAYGVTGTTLTYVPANNGGYTLTVIDRIQFDFYY